MNENNEIDVINQQISDLVAKKDALVSARKHEVIKAVRKQIAEYSLTARDLGLTGERIGNGKAEPKYANPDNKSQTWSGGRGAKPGWVRDHLAKGGSLDDLLIR